MKIYLAGMGAKDKELLKVAEDLNRPFRRLISFAYMSDANKLIKLKENKREKKRTVKRTYRRKARNSK